MGGVRVSKGFQNPLPRTSQLKIYEKKMHTTGRFDPTHEKFLATTLQRELGVYLEIFRRIFKLGFEIFLYRN